MKLYWIFQTLFYLRIASERVSSYKQFNKMMFFQKILTIFLGEALLKILKISYNSGI